MAAKGTKGIAGVVESDYIIFLYVRIKIKLTGYSAN
jgi:hypothetical protein